MLQLHYSPNEHLIELHSFNPNGGIGTLDKIAALILALATEWSALSAHTHAVTTELQAGPLLLTRSDLSITFHSFATVDIKKQYQLSREQPESAQSVQINERSLAES